MMLSSTHVGPSRALAAAVVTIGIVDWTAAASFLAVEAVNVKDMVGSEADRHSSTSKDSKNDDDDKQKCGLYLAVSSTSTAEAPKLGVFAGKDIEADTPIGPGGDVAIHTMHLMSNQLWVDEETLEMNDSLDDNHLANIVDWFEQFIWVPHSSGGQFELAEADARIVTAIPGIGVMGSYNPKLTNADWNHSSAYHREAWNEYPGEPHPGRGAYSNYYNLQMAATEVIPAGKEIFLEFGENWEEENEKQKEMLTRKEYEQVDQTIEKIIAFFDKYNDELDQASKLEIYQFLMKDVMEAAAGSGKGKQIARMLPDDPSKLKEVLDAGGAFYLSSPKAVRKLDWLETNGLCMDNIKPGPSTIPYAGRGAFATRKIPAGGLVAPVPLIQIPDEDILDMHRMKTMKVESTESETEEETIFVRDGEEDADVTGKQLLLNYCWGHPESSLLLFPTGAVVNYINHNFDKSKVNARMVWSDHPSNRKEWFNISPDDMLVTGSDYIGLLMELVAIKDIEEGDEIFLDYGEHWEESWNRHVAEWNSRIEKDSSKKTWPIRAIDLNQEHKSHAYRTKDEEPYPDNVMIKCFLMVKKPENGIDTEESTGHKIRVWSESESGKTNLVSDNLFDCTIVKRYDIDPALPTNNTMYDIAWSSGTSTTIVKNVPHKAIIFLDKPGTGDQHEPLSFRHWVGIPDDVFPKGPWRNMQTSEDDGKNTK